MINNLVEDWVTECLGVPYAELLGRRRTGMPTVSLQCEFTAVSRMGDDVMLGLSVEKLGGKSLTLHLGCRRGDEQRMRVRQVLVFTSLDTHQAVDVPADLRAAIETFQFDERGPPMTQLLQPPGWARPKGYANGVAVSGRQVFVAGMIGWDGQGQFHTDDLAGQVRQALLNVVAVLAEGGAKPEHIVRMTWYVTDKREYLAAARDIGAAFREIIGSFNAAMTAVQVSALIEDRAKVEIEVTAVIPD